MLTARVPSSLEEEELARWTLSIVNIPQNLPRVMAPPPHSRLLDHNIPLVAMHQPCQQRRDKEHDAIHDSECKASFEHRTGFVGVERVAVGPRHSIRSYRDGDWA